jgi:PleD family two-component response regulator
MPLILAIEPDRRQATQLKAMVRARLEADLVLAESVDQGLLELGDRIPDLILTSALLSPRDEVALDQRLRALDGTACFVQTLTIPVFAATPE